MVTVLINLLVVLLILSVVFYIVRLAAGQFGAPAFVVQIVGLILGLVFLLYLLRALGVVAAWPALR
jgi:hypothetical protein